MSIKPLLIALLLLLLHLPFLNSDPDTNISFSRDAFTDEGLYTAQVRNYILTGNFNLDESDAAVKTPLFSGLILGWFSITGVSLTSARLLVLLISLIVFYFITRKAILTAIILSCLVFLQFTIFHYTHIALAEMLSVTCLFVAWHFMTVNRNAGYKYKHAVLAGLMISCAWWLKFQYVYMIAWPFVFYFLLFCFKKIDRIKILRCGLVACLTTIGLGIFYFLIWYLPSRDFFDFVLKAQASKPFGEGEWFWKMIDFNIDNYFLNGSMLPLTVLFLLMMVASPFILYRNRTDIGFVLQLLGVFSWCLLELYKPALAYLPGRYLVSTFFAMGIFICICIIGITRIIPQKNLRLFIICILLSVPIAGNLNQYYQAFMRRTYLLSEANDFVAANSTPGCYVAGPWAASVTWKSQAPSIPVWIDYFNDKNTITRYKPCIIVSELDEEDSGSAWKNQGVDLAKIAKSTYDFKFRNWQVRVYVIGR